MEAGLTTDQVSVPVERDALRGHGGVQFGEGLEVLVDDGLVDVDPEGLGGLQLRAVATVFQTVCLRKSAWSLTMALRMVRSFLAQAVMASLVGLPASWRRFRKARIVGS